MDASGKSAHHSRNRNKSEDEENRKTPKFVFVDVSDPVVAGKPATRRLIHQHAMKEIGKSRRRPKKNLTVTLDIASLQGTESPSAAASSWLGSISKWSGPNRLDAFVRYPMELDATARELIAYGELPRCGLLYAALGG